MILLVNDDGIEHPGLRKLYRALREVTGQAVLAVAPASQRSGQAHAVTLDRGLAVAPVKEEDFFGFSVDGTPTDCVKIGLSVLCSEPPQLVVSGINDGPNTGRSIFYSGTVSAAVEGAIEGFAALAVSRDRGGDDFADAARFGAEVAKFMLERGEFQGQVVNLNVPSTPAASWRPTQIVSHGRAGFSESYRPVRDAHDRVTWHLHGVWTAEAGGGETDAHYLRGGHPVLTTLAPDFNADQKALQKLLAGKTRAVSRAAKK